MSIPSYNEIYEFPGGYPPFGRHHYHHQHDFKPSYVRETSKNVEICDKFGKTRYVVKLTSEQIAPGEQGYKIVVECIYPDQGLIPILRIPENENEYETSYDVAMSNFNMCVQKYQSLINAEMRDFRDIDVYKENIGYEVQDVECCATCKWCIKTFECNKHCSSRKILKKLQCCCPMNEQVFNYAQQFPQMPHCKPFNGWKKLPWQNANEIKHLQDEFGQDAFGAGWDPSKFPNIMFPEVNQFGKCDNYASGKGYEHYGKPHTPAQYQIASSIASAFDPKKHFDAGELVYFGGKLYQCINPHIGNWNDNDFKQITISDALQQKTSIDDLSVYVRNDVLSGYTISKNPTQHEIADVTKWELSVLGGTVEQ